MSRISTEPLTVRMFLMFDYRPSQPHGWPDGNQPLGVTYGGHTVATDFTVDDQQHRVSLVPAEPEYLATPTDQLRQTLDAAFGTHYAFRFARHRSGPFSIQSYSVSVDSLSFGADLYVVHDTEPLTVARGTMRWLQVSQSSDGAPTVDGTGPANPFHPTGGSVSVNGTRVGNFSSRYAAPLMPPVRDFRFTAEAFLAWDSGVKDGSGREIVEVFGGVAYGWEVSS